MVSRPVPRDSSEEPTEKRADRASAGAEDTVASGPRVSSTPLSLLDDPNPRFRESALSMGFNGATALWSRGRRGEGLAMAKRFFEAAKDSCDQPEVRALRACLAATQGYASLLAWEDDPAYPALRARSVTLQALVLERDADSSTSRYDAMVASFERGDFEEAHRFAIELRSRDAAAWATEMGPLAAALSGQLDEVDAWAPLVTGGGTGSRVALGLRDAARGRYRDAARTLRSIDAQKLWFDISWSPHPAVSLKLPAAAQPSFEIFLADFTRAYGAADMPALGASVEQLASALDAL